MNPDPDLMQDQNFHDTCNNLSDPIGNTTGQVFGYGTYAAAVEGGPAGVAAAGYVISHYHLDDKVDHLVGGFVHDGWHDVCTTAENIGDGVVAFADGVAIAWNELVQETAELGHSIAESYNTGIYNFDEQLSLFVNGEPKDPDPVKDEHGFLGGSENNAESSSPFWGDSDTSSSNTSFFSGDNSSSSWGGSDNSANSSWGGDANSSSWGGSDNSDSTSTSSSSDGS
jgi:hypothetical protein